MLLVAGHRLGGERDDGGVVAGGAERAGKGVAVHLGHLHVGEEQVVRGALRDRLLDHVEGDAPVVRDIHRRAGLAEKMADEALVVGAVLGENDAPEQPSLR